MAAPRWLNEAEFRAWIGYRRMRLLLDTEVARDLVRTSGLSAPDYDVLSALSEGGNRFVYREPGPGARAARG